MQQYAMTKGKTSDFLILPALSPPPYNTGVGRLPNRLLLLSSDCIKSYGRSRNAGIKKAIILLQIFLQEAECPIAPYR